MITSPENYNQLLDSIVNPSSTSNMVRTTTPETEPMFLVNLNSRTITVPDSLKYIGVIGDHQAETIYFEVDRYFDDYDLTSDGTVCYIQYRNAAGNEAVTPSLKMLVSGSNKIRFGWTITNQVALSAGAVTFAVRFYKIENQQLVYSLNTKPATIYISDGMLISEDSPNFSVPLTDIEDLLTQIRDELKNYDNIVLNPLINGKELTGGTDYTSADLELVGISDLLKNLQDKTALKNNGINYNSLEGLLKATNIFDPYLTSGNIDSELNESSTNAIQNQAVVSRFNSIDEQFTVLNDSIDNSINNVVKDLDNRLTLIDEEFEIVREEIGNSVYIPIEITSFDNNIKVVEKGSSVNEITFTYSFNQVPNELALLYGEDRNVTLPTEDNLYTLSGLDLKEDTIFTLVAADKKNHNEMAISAIEFLNGVYYGVAEEPEAYDDSFVMGLNKNLQKNHKGSFNTEATEGQYIYYCAPSSYGYPYLSVNGLIGGFEKVQTINFKNSYDHEEEYDIYRSEYSNLGSTLVKAE